MTRKYKKNPAGQIRLSLTAGLILVLSALSGCAAGTDNADVGRYLTQPAPLPASTGSSQAPSAGPIDEQQAVKAWKQAEADLLDEANQAKQEAPTKQEAQYAARQRSWPPISLASEGTGVTAVLSTTWHDLNLNWRVTLSGSKQELGKFFDNRRGLRVRLFRTSGVSNFQFPLFKDDFKWMSTGADGRKASLSAQGSLFCRVSTYESARDWNLTWSK